MKWLGTVAGIDLIAHGTTSDEDTIRDTAVAQPLIVSAGMVSLLSLFPHPGEAFAKVPPLLLTLSLPNKPWF
jgi:[acyl-carrier-protein] S-malonyltransferase